MLSSSSDDGRNSSDHESDCAGDMQDNDDNEESQTATQPTGVEAFPQHLSHSTPGENP